MPGRNRGSVRGIYCVSDKLKCTPNDARDNTGVMALMLRLRRKGIVTALKAAGAKQ
jgi:hypothetical protein